MKKNIYAFKQALKRARNAQLNAQLATTLCFEQLYNLIDNPDEISVSFETVNSIDKSLTDVINCYINYGEGDINDIMKEVENESI